MKTALHAMNWNDLPDIGDTANITERDEECLNDIKHVLERYGLMHKFGITLLHSHFQVADDEVFLEHTDMETKTLVSRPVKLSEIANKPYRPTVWRFDGPKAEACSYCPTDRKGDHLGYKEPC